MRRNACKSACRSSSVSSLASIFNSPSVCLHVYLSVCLCVFILLHILVKLCALDTVIRAADRCSQEKRKTLTGDDILFAMATLGFDNYIEPMKLYLQKIREVCTCTTESAIEYLLPQSYHIM